MSEELKPCSCGSTDTSIGYESPQGYWVECGDCGRQTEKSHGRDLAIAARNRRAQPAEVEGVEIVAYATPDEYGGWQMLFFDEKEAMLYVEKNEQPSALVLHSALSAVTAERDRLRDEVARLESAWHVETMNRKDGIIARQEQENDRVKAERDQLRAEVEALRNEAASEPNIYRAVVHALRRAADGQRFGAAKVQRTFLLGYNSAVRLIEEMARRGDIVPDEGAGEEGWAYKFPDAAMAEKEA